MVIELNDYKEEGVITPKLWFEESGIISKIKDFPNIKHFIITFPYMKFFIEKAKHHNFKNIEWYPNLGVFEFEGKKIGLFISPIGAPATTLGLEELIYIGGKFFLLVGGVGVLDERIRRGDIVIPNGGIRDEGTSYHYLPPKECVHPSNYLTEILKTTCKDMNLVFHIGKVWTTDAPYRETPTRIRKFRSMKAICVDMEAAACFAVAEYRNVELAAVFYGGDYVSENSWSFRKDYLERSKYAQETLFRIACRTLKEVNL